MAVDKKAHFKAWDPGCTHILGDDKFYFLYAYYGGAEMERKISANRFEAKELWGQAVEWDSF